MGLLFVVNRNGHFLHTKTVLEIVCYRSYSQKWGLEYAGRRVMIASKMVCRFTLCKASLRLDQYIVLDHLGCHSCNMAVPPQLTEACFSCICLVVTSLLMVIQVDIAKLNHFHKAHFPKQEPPTLRIAHDTSLAVQSQQEEKNEDSLGYYEDGVKRTLTDDQIAMFRNSEIQRLIGERRRIKEQEEEYQLRRARRERHDDRLQHQHRQRHADSAVIHNIETLTYDDDSNPAQNGPKTFLWPKLGS